MRYALPPPDEIRSEFERTLRDLSMKGVLLPSCPPFDGPTIEALDAVAAEYPNVSSASIAIARARLEDSLRRT